MTAQLANPGTWRRIPWRRLGWGGGALFVLLPVVVGAPWSLGDFIFAGVLVGLVGGGIELAVRQGNAAYSLAAGLALGACLLSAWIPGAIGIIGSERDAANALYLGVVLVAVLGAIAALLRARGMALAMAAAAIAELLVPVAAWFLWPAVRDAILQPEVPLMTLLLVGMWGSSAWLFRAAGREQALLSPARSTD